MRPHAISRTWVVACALAVSASIVSAESPFDPGPGRDASDLRDSPTQIPFGAYAGILPASDADWYAANATAAPRCTQLRSQGTVGHELTLSTRGAFVHAVTTTVGPNQEARLFIAGPATQRAIAGFTSLTSEDGAYDFTLQSWTASELGSVDTGTTGDASSFLQNAPEVAAGCLRGTVGVKDTSDVFAFRVSGPEQIVYSLGAVGASSPRLSVLDAAGTVLGSVTSGEIGSLHLPAAGAYYLSTTVPLDASMSEYVIGLLGPEPPGGPCRPYCRVS